MTSHYGVTIMKIKVFCARYSHLRVSPLKPSQRGRPPPTPPPPFVLSLGYAWVGLEKKNKEKTFLVQVPGPFLVKWLLFPFFNTDATSKCTCSNIVLNETFFITFWFRSEKKRGWVKVCVCVSPINHGLLAHLIPYRYLNLQSQDSSFFLDTEWNIESRKKCQNLSPWIQLLKRKLSKVVKGQTTLVMSNKFMVNQYVDNYRPDLHYALFSQ